MEHDDLLDFVSEAALPAKDIQNSKDQSRSASIFEFDTECPVVSTPQPLVVQRSRSRRLFRRRVLVAAAWARTRTLEIVPPLIHRARVSSGRSVALLGRAALGITRACIPTMRTVDEAGRAALDALRRPRKTPVPLSVAPFLLGVLVGGTIVVGMTGRLNVESTQSVAAAAEVTPPAGIVEPAPPRVAVPAAVDAPKPRVSYIGTLRVDSRPQGAAVFVNAKRAGTTPISLAKLPVGSRAVRLEMDGFEDWSSVVQVVSGQSTAVSAVMRAEDATH